ncbi:hypothetical protein [Streptomyces justiciae]|uniref:DUF1579 domain-containing protein n=1 Tax=Streptomyces justiciae TaxID=2780140 RepID=A0ABU3LZM6_9ACTN|nr:hypothetical protein [Streptomyces justiciae]MDT7844685.1 hypothetical protein [Streptomyces justiciae]
MEEVPAVGGAAWQEALERLGVLVGEWVVEADLADPDVPAGRSVFAWDLDGRFLVQRTEIPVAGAPDSMAVIAVDPESGAYTYHYFDSRGVVRTYAMRFDGVEWLLLRETADFSPLSFRQRFVGRVGDGVIQGAWELAKDESAPWERDFGLTYRRSGR